MNGNPSPATSKRGKKTSISMQATHGGFTSTGTIGFYKNGVLSTSVTASNIKSTEPGSITFDADITWLADTGLYTLKTTDLYSDYNYFTDVFRVLATPAGLQWTFLHPQDPPPITNLCFFVSS